MTDFCQTKAYTSIDGRKEKKNSVREEGFSIYTLKKTTLVLITLFFNLYFLHPHSNAQLHVSYFVCRSYAGINLCSKEKLTVYRHGW